MNSRTSLPRPSAPLTLVTGFLLASSAWAQSGAEPESVYHRRSSADATPRMTAGLNERPLQSSRPAPARELYPQPAAAAKNGRAPSGQARQTPSRSPQLYPQPQRLAALPGRGLASAASLNRPQGGVQPSPAQAPARGQRPIRDPNVMPSFYPAPLNNPPPEAAKEVESPASIPAAAPGEHKLLPAVRWAKTGVAKLEQIKDYSCVMHKRERIDGTLGEAEAMFVKVRHEPFSVYVYFLGPTKVKGQEAIYVRGQNDGNIVAHPIGFKKKLVGAVSLKPDSMLAMQGNRYPMTELGIKRLTERLIEVGEHDCQFGECEVNVKPGAKVNRRDCTLIEVIHPVPRREFLFHLAKIYVDSEYNLPTRYEAYEWPQEAGGSPVLTEEYTYTRLKFNNGFTDKDFDPENPDYDFK
ncbi:MAG TPA: DUF1571 domain-containing protein [Pirellulales bacterium]|nr:DUF1571 domain-containing protein [Pirellulales bacterium]